VRDLSAPPPNYVPIGWQSGGFNWIRPWSQLIRLQDGQIIPGSPNGIHGGTNGILYLGGVPAPNATRALQSGLAAPSATGSLYGNSSGVQTSIPLTPVGLGARPSVNDPDAA